MYQRLPVDHDFTIYRGATFRQRMRWSPGGEPKNFTDWDAWMPFGPANEQEPLRELNVSNGGIILTSDGYITLYISDEDTTEIASLDMPINGEVGHLVYNISLKQPDGDVIRFMRGNLYVQWDVGRPK